MSDGAHLGVGAERALGTVLGNDPQPAAEERMSAGEMAEWVMAATSADANSYDGCARYAAKLVLTWLLEDPTRASSPPENEYDDAYNVTTPGWYDRMKADGSPVASLDLTGFMWGWAVNAARRCVELPPSPNPAIVSI